MARKGYGRADSLVSIGTYPDDGSSPVGTDEWNKNPKTDGIFGFAKSTAGISSNGITVTDSYVEVTDAGTIHKILSQTTALSTTYYGSGTDGASTSIKSFAEGDLIYVIKANGVGTVTLNHQQSGVTEGKINTLSGGNITLDENVPKIFMCRNKDQAGNLEWFEYGGGVVTTPTDITVADTTDTTCFPALFESATGDLEPKTDAGITYNAGTGVLTATGFAGPLTGNVTGNASGSSGSCTGNSATTTALANARTIGGTSFDGTANIAVALSATATALATARTIGGVSFDGTANINLPGVNASGTQDTSGTSAVATTVTISDNESTNESNLLTFTSGGASTGNIALESDGDLNYNPSTGQLASTKVYGLSELRTGGNLVLGGDLDATTSATDVDLIDNNASALSFDSAGKAGILQLVTTDGSEKVTMSGDLEITGGLTVSGTTTTINSTTLTVDDKNIELASTGSPSDAGANLGGITLRGDTDKTIIWDNANDNWTSNQDWNIASGKVFRINNANTLSATALGSAVVGSSLTSVGTIATGVWNGTAVADSYIASASTWNAKLATTLTSAQLFVGNGSNVATGVAMSGDIAISNAGATTIQAGAVDIAMLSATGTASSSTYLRGDNSWQAISSGFTATADDDLDFVGDYDIEDLQRICFEVQSTGYTLNATHNENRTGESQMFVRTIDSNNEGLFIRLKKNGSSNYEEIQIA